MFYLLKKAPYWGFFFSVLFFYLNGIIYICTHNNNNKNNNNMSASSYDKYLDTTKETGYLFKSIPFLNISPILFAIVATFVSFYFIGSYAIHLLITILCFEQYCIARVRYELTEDCEVDEAVMQNDFIENGIDPNFPEDPLYVTESDREFIFKECYALSRKKYNLTYKIKTRFGFLIFLLSINAVLFCLSFYAG